MENAKIAIPGYKNLDMLYQSSRSVVYRALRNEDNLPIVLKLLNSDYPSPGLVARFQQEYQLMHGFHEEHLVHAINIQAYQNSYFIVLEDFGGFPLSDKVCEGGMDIALFLELALQIAQALGEIHRKEIIHKDIKPANILFDPQTHQIKISDFGQAVLIPKETSSLQDPSVLEGSLAYMSPEQTGRMNRDVDYRSDFYSLGVTFYELLTGVLPFSERDPLALIHSHLARSPVSPTELRPEIPKALSNIVLKLMAKEAEARYQSNYGLIVDLETCQQQWKETRSIQSFILGQHDHSDRFSISQKLYGREENIRLLLDVFDRVCAGNSELFLVTGEAGIGKSALVQEIYRPITQSRGYFIGGKFDQFHKNIPYSSLVQAFRDLVRQLLTETEKQIGQWRENILAALGPNGKIVSDVIPDIEHIIGPQEAVLELGPVENQNRFRYVFQQFIQVFTRKKHPLVLFLDDLQWADSSSLDLIQDLLSSNESHYFLLIAAYRNQEVDEHHPLKLMLDQLIKNNAMISEASLVRLKKNHIQQLIADSLSQTLATAEDLAQLILEKTEGNPFFVNEFLKTLYDKKSLQFSLAEGRWVWDIEQIQHEKITDNVVQLMKEKIELLPAKTQYLLQLASCMGNEFHLEDLSLTTGFNGIQIIELLQTALMTGIIFPLSENYKWAGMAAVNSSSKMLNVHYCFAHDRVQQAAYAMIRPEQLAQFHLQIGKALLEKIPIEKREARFISIVNHLNQSISLIQDRAEKNNLSELNLQAARKAKSSAAYGPAYEYARTGLSLLATDAFDLQYDLYLHLNIEAAELAYLNRDFKNMDKLIEACLPHAIDALDKVALYEVQIQGYAAQHKVQEAIKIGIHAIRLLGESFPEKPGKIQILASLLSAKLSFFRREIEDIEVLPPMTDPFKLAICSVQMKILASTYLVSPESFAIIAFKSIKRSLRYGNAPDSPTLWSAYAVILNGLLGDINQGDRVVQSALKLSHQSSGKRNLPRLMVAYHGFLQHWKEPLQKTLTPLVESHRLGLEVGDLEYASWSAFFYITNSFYSGKELSALTLEARFYSHLIEKYHHQTQQFLVQIFHQAVENLIHFRENPYSLQGEAADEAGIFSSFLKEKDKGGIVHVYFLKLMLAYLFGAYPQALEFSQSVFKYFEGMLGTSSVPLAYFYDALTRLQLYSQQSLKHKFYTRLRSTNCIIKFKKWARHSPQNYKHKYYLLLAEKARVSGHPQKAAQFYDQAIDLSRQQNFLNDEALAYELAGRFYLETNNERIASLYLRNAHYAYKKWGANAKVQDLETKYPKFLIALVGENSSPQSSLPSTTGSTKRTFLDLNTVLQASRLLSSEIELKSLLKKLVDLLIQNAGAARAYLILVDGKRLLVQASENDTAQHPQAMSLEAAEQAQMLAPEIVQYVYRTQENVVVHEAARDERFSHFNYIQKNQPKSILCIPLLNQKELIGIVYLENNLSSHAFTEDRVELVKLLGAQAAISISNAQSILERKEKDRLKLEQERLTMENELLDRQSKELEKLNADKDRFFSIISHDLRSPFNPILGFADVIAKHGHEMEVSQVEEMAQSIHQAGSNALALLDNLLQWSRMQTGRMGYEPQDFNLGELAKRNIKLLQPVAEQKNINLFNTIHPLISVYADENMIDTILRNLISNAIKFTPHGGSITLSVEEDPDHFIVSVADTGVGIDEAQIEKLFSQGTHFTSQGTSGEHGTGLGLLMCQELIEKNHGKIWVKSQKEKGSIFYFSLLKNKKAPEEGLLK